MYEDLINKLRELPHLLFVQLGEHEDVVYQAADAIEDLSRDLDSMNDANIALYGALPRWIPVTERLPSPKFVREWYLVSLESGCVQTLAFEKGGYSFEFDKDGFSDNLFRPGWHETASPVTHWMPLPEPPKEET